MKRRDVLHATGLAVAGLAGCVSEQPADGGSNDETPTNVGDETEPSTPSPTATPSPTVTASPTATASPTPTPSSALADSTFTVEKVTPGQGANQASVSFDDGVTVDGTIRGNNGCYTASLKRAEVADGALSVVVEAHEKEGSEMCTQSLVDVRYRARFAFDGDLPATVVVEHVTGDERTTVAETER